MIGDDSDGLQRNFFSCALGAGGPAAGCSAADAAAAAPRRAVCVTGGRVCERTRVRVCAFKWKPRDVARRAHRNRA